MLSKPDQSTLLPQRSLPALIPHIPSKLLNKARRSILLTKPDQVLASSHSRPTKLRCSDLWSRKMQKEAVKILWAKNDALAERRLLRNDMTRSQPTEESKVSQRLSHYIQRVRSVEIPAINWQFQDQNATYVQETHLQKCAQLQSEVHSELTKLKADLARSKKKTPQLIRLITGEETDLTDFVKGEVADFRKGPLRPELMRKSSASSLAKRMNRLGLSFYSIQRRRPLP